ncbi:hypothetical protein FQR65_LT12023 [Abscondita terminalis]|nr:hypothetical protein FQR65_LT12023 [Abscondita terminalis]
MLVKLFALLVIHAFIVETRIINTTTFFKNLQTFNSPSSFGDHLLSLVKKNETRFISAKCLQHLWEYGNSLLRFESWALLMFDASEKIPNGILRGNGGALGEFDQCIDIKQETSVGTINGKYCAGTLPVIDLEDYPIMLTAHKPKFINIKDMEAGLLWGVCLPESCTSEEFRYVTLTLFEYSEHFCQTLGSETKELDSADTSTIILLGITFGIVITSTVVNKIFNKINKRNKISHSFSFSVSVEEITKVEENEITCLYGMRTITLLFLTVAFKFLLLAITPVTNWLFFIKMLLNKYNIIVLETFVCIDTFLLMSGMLVSYKYLNEKQRGNRFNIIFYYINRIIRLTPALAITVLISATIMRHFGTGPIWPSIRDTLIVDSCAKYWWSSLLYVQNYVNPGFKSVCNLPTWYLSLDMQLFILSPLLLIPLGKVPKFTIICALVLLFCSIASPFIATWVYDLKAIFIYTIHPVELNRYMAHFLFPLHTRSASWIIGFLLGYVLHESKKISNRNLIEKIFSPLVVTLLWTLSGGLLVMCLFISQLFLEKEYNWLTNAFHISLIRPAWSLSISWIIFACEHGYSGPINTILSASPMRVISKISYCTFLVNFVVLLILNQQNKKGVTFTILSFVSTMWSDIIWCLIFGFLLAVSIERPLLRLYKSYMFKYGNLVNHSTTTSKTLMFDLVVSSLEEDGKRGVTRISSIIGNQNTKQFKIKE